MGSDVGMWGRNWECGVGRGIDHLGGDRGGEAGAHRRQRVVEQHRVGLEGGVRARDVDLVHAVVEAEDRRRLQREEVVAEVRWRRRRRRRRRWWWWW